MRFGAALILAACVCPLGAQAPAAEPANPFGAPVRTSTSHLTVESAVSATSVSPGDKVSVTVDVTPRRTMHVYAPGKHDYQVVSLSMAAEPWLAAQPTKYPPSEIYHFEPLDERIEVYSKPFRLTRDVTVLSTDAARKALAGRRSITLAGTLEYQACDDKVCYAPARVPVSFTLSLREK